MKNFWNIITKTIGKWHWLKSKEFVIPFIIGYLFFFVANFTNMFGKHLPFWFFMGYCAIFGFLIIVYNNSETIKKDLLKRVRSIRQEIYFNQAIDAIVDNDQDTFDILIGHRIYYGNYRKHLLGLSSLVQAFGIGELNEEVRKSLLSNKCNVRISIVVLNQERNKYVHNPEFY